MKDFSIKVFSILIIFFSVLNLSAQEIPEILYGKWECKDRFITFSEDNLQNQQLIVNLKTYYGLYNDRAAEPEELSKKNPRIRNIANHIDAEHIPFEISPLIVNDKPVDNAFSMKIKYSTHDESLIPFIILEDKIYFEFYVQVNNHCFAQFGSSDGIKLNRIPEKENIACLVFVNLSDENKNPDKSTKVFDIRYWKTDMEFSNESAFFKWNENDYYVPKHILSGNQNYSCTSGRSTKIRNVMAPDFHNYEDFQFFNNSQIAIKKNSEFLWRTN